MTADSSHPDALDLQAYVEHQVDPGGVSSHLQSCDLCGTLALTFRDAGRLHVVDPSLYENKQPYRAGGMGKTYTARDVRIGREVVIKEPADPPPAAHAGAALRMERRLLRERRILGMVEHPAVVPIHETGQWPDGTPFFTMRRIHGPTLAEVIEAAPSFAQRIVLLPQFVSITEAIAHAHVCGVVHRDLTPDNMMLGPLREPYVIDWGIATLCAGTDEGVLDTIEPASDGLTRGGVGKEPYAPLEQIQGQTPTPTFDVYSLGVTLHHLLVGRRPRQLHTGDLEKLPKECPEELVSIVRRATALAPERRFPDAGELAKELRRYQSGKLVEAHRYTLPARARRWSRRYRSVLALLAAAGIATAAGIVANEAHQQRLQAQQEAKQAQTAAETANENRRAAEEKAALARTDQKAAMDKWSKATARSRQLTQQLDQERRLSSQELERLNLAIEAERVAAKEAMELRLAAELARHEAEQATARALQAEQEALSQARDAQAAREQAEQRAKKAQARATDAETRAARAELRAKAATLKSEAAERAADAARLEADEAHQQIQELRKAEAERAAAQETKAQAEAKAAQAAGTTNATPTPPTGRESQVAEPSSPVTEKPAKK